MRFKLYLLLAAVSALLTIFFSWVLFSQHFGTGLGWLAWSGGWTAFWIWRAIVRRRKDAERFWELSQVCQSCGSDGNPGYRVCNNCGRVKHPAL